MHWTTLLFATLILCPPADASRPTDGTPGVPTVEVGDREVKGKLLKPFDNQWSRSGRPGAENIRETTRIERVDGKKCYIRDQVFPMQQGLAMHTELVLDAKTLETVSMQKEIVGLPPGASLGGRPVFARWDFDGASFTRTIRAEADPVVSEGALDSPMFNGGGLGLVIAALPLKLGYEALVPVAMSLNLSGDLTLYQAHLRVVGTEAIARPRGKDVEAWIVDVDWIDPETGEVTSKGGYDQPGGAYYVLTRPPKGLPHVPRYANDGGVIDLVVEPG